MNFQYILKCLLSSLIPTVIFIAISSFFVHVGIITYRGDGLVSASVIGVPIEEVLINFILSLGGIGIYIYLNHRFPNNDPEKFSLSVSNLLLGVCVAMLFFSYTKWYSLPAFSSFFLLLLYIEYINKRRFMYRFYRTFIVSLLLYYPLEILFINLSGTSWLYEETVKLKVAGIPLENYFYFLAMLLLNVYLFEVFKARSNK